MKRLIALSLVTFSALMLELTLIRWVAGQVRIAAYFPNLILISAFFGMGIGCLRQGKKSWYCLMPMLLLVLVALAYLGRGIAFSSAGKGGSEYFWLLYYNLPKDAPVVNNLIFPLWIIFILTTLVFIPLGQQVADILKECQDENKTLLGYAFDLGGSLVGVIVFTLLSFLSTFPVVWFSLGLLPGIFVFGRRYKQLAVYIAASLAVVLLVRKAEYADVYSPYYSLGYDFVSQEGGDQSLINVTTNGSLHQVMVPVRSNLAKQNEFSRIVQEGFFAPFSYLRETPSNALVLGAGTGNDVSVLLAHGVPAIDAVEIDPAILELGKALHPDQPYASDRVNTYIDDARSFLNKSQKKYDLIIFGTLDSMTRLSALSNVRLDNFVYTRESLEAAKRLLSPRGGIILHFMVGEKHIDGKILSLLAEVFGEFPIVHDKHCRLFNRSYMVGPAFAHVDKEIRDVRYSEYKVISEQFPTELPSDDWPYLYLESRQIGSFYLKMIGTVFLTAIGFMIALGWSERREKPLWKAVDMPMFLFGAAFLILNSKSVTELGLLWGNTWMTNAVTFASILFVLLVSTLVFAYKPLPLNACFYALFGSLLVLYLFPLPMLLGLPLVIKLFGSVVFVGSPFFFAGACFAGVFKSSDHVPFALGWNVIGALCGGLLEYLNMLLGFKALYLLALIFYLVAFMMYNRQKAYPGIRTN